ncbi:type II toxin-antitoxin system death-on-curing family toxin [uncultured Selenomonas sp.]|jgi:death-on-curing protein|uniref:type II toxin-antitoxin system death-on-curing family toxin n=1 Tax=uncultured Selenomonas sp. TaxID=159275 RepID=UPI0025FAFAE8|nr:type II toxin-antitoxin system death-on-curing family toxin [uncultured Selenomonas sp.]
MIRLTKTQILQMHEELLVQTGGSDGVRDEGLLEAALAAPFLTFGGKDLYPTMEGKAACLGFGLIKNHAMIDGNKRIGAHAMLVFLALNGMQLCYTQEELYTIILEVASSEKSQADLCRWILAHER